MNKPLGAMAGGDAARNSAFSVDKNSVSKAAPASATVVDGGSEPRNVQTSSRKSVSKKNERPSQNNARNSGNNGVFPNGKAQAVNGSKQAKKGRFKKKNMPKANTNAVTVDKRNVNRASFFFDRTGDQGNKPRPPKTAGGNGGKGKLKQNSKNVSSLRRKQQAQSAASVAVAADESSSSDSSGYESDKNESLSADEALDADPLVGNRLEENDKTEDLPELDDGYCADFAGHNDDVDSEDVDDEDDDKSEGHNEVKVGSSIVSSDGNELKVKSLVKTRRTFRNGELGKLLRRVRYEYWDWVALPDADKLDRKLQTISSESSLWRCKICDVTQKGGRALDIHLGSGRHARNEATLVLNTELGARRPDAARSRFVPFEEQPQKGPAQQAKKQGKKSKSIEKRKASQMGSVDENGFAGLSAANSKDGGPPTAAGNGGAAETGNSSQASSEDGALLEGDRKRLKVDPVVE